MGGSTMMVAAVMFTAIVVAGVGFWVLTQAPPATMTSSSATGPASTRTVTSVSSTTTGTSVATTTTTTTVSSTKSVGNEVLVTIALGAGSNTSSKGYFPANLMVVLGVNNTVLWANKDNVPHTVSSSSSSQPFNSGNLDPGMKYSYTFTRPGIYQYYCAYHGWMYGTITVRA